MLTCDKHQHRYWYQIDLPSCVALSDGGLMCYEPAFGHKEQSKIDFLVRHLHCFENQKLNRAALIKPVSRKH